MDILMNNYITVREFVEMILAHEDILDKPLRGIGVRSDSRYVIRYGINNEEITVREFKEDFQKRLDKRFN